MTEYTPLFHALPVGGCINRWHVSGELAEHFPGTPRPMPDTIDFRFVNGWVETGDLPCREAWRRDLAARRDGARPVPPPMDGVHLGGEDERVDFSSFRFRPTLVTRWARAPIDAACDVRARFEVDTCGALALWIDGVRRLDFSPCSRNHPAAATFACDLPAGRHEILVRATELHERDTDFHFRLRLLDGAGLSSGLDAALDEARLARVERLLRSLRFEREFHEGGSVRVRADDAPDEPETLRVETGGAWSGSRTLNLPGDAHPSSSPLAIRLSRDTPSATLFEVPPLHAGCLTFRFVVSLDGVEIGRRLGTTLLPPPIMLSPSASLDTRKREALELLVERGQDGPSRALVLLDALARDGGDDPDDASRADAGRAAEAESLLGDALRVVDERHDCADFQLMPLLWIQARHRDRLTPTSRGALERSLLGFRYWLDEPGDDVMWFWSENHVLCFIVAAHVAGHAFAERRFANGARLGAELAAAADARLGRWFDAIERHGFGEWNASAYYPIDLIGLLTLVELGSDAALVARARALSDTLFRLTALHLSGGVPAGSEGRAYEKELLSGPANELGSVAAIAFGGPWYPGHDRASVLFALSEYVPPGACAALARVPSGRVACAAWSQGLDGLARLVLWKSRHAQLSAVVDHGSGAPGHQQHVLDVQLAAHPMARFWVNHPGELVPWGDGRPSYLAGNGRLPRVAVHGCHAAVLFDLPDAPEVAPFTHARVPDAACDELVEDADWLFARSGGGYVGLFAARGFEPPAERRRGRRERRQHGRRQAWLVVVGGRDLDGDFARFETRCRALAPDHDETGGGRLAFDAPDGRVVVAFDGATSVDGRRRPPPAFPVDGHARVAWHDGTASTRCGRENARVERPGSH